jgi:hypothetical protein
VERGGYWEGSSLVEKGRVLGGIMIGGKRNGIERDHDWWKEGGIGRDRGW